MPTGEIRPRDADPVSREAGDRGGEKREILTINTTIQVRRFDRVDLEGYLREFYSGPGPGAGGGHRKGRRNKGYSKIVWSVQPKATADERKRLGALIPSITG